MTLEATPFPVDRLAAFTGIAVATTGSDSISISQSVGPRFLDHRGHTTIGSVGVLTDLAVGAPVGAARLHATGVKPGVVMSQITASTAHPFPTTGMISGHGRSIYYDDVTGLSEATMFDGSGNPVLHLVGRSIVVGRAKSVTPAAETACHITAADLEPEAWADTGVLDELPGLDIVSGIAAGTLPRGPVAGLLGLNLTGVEHGTVSGEIAPLDWMANSFDTIHGGVLMSMAEVVSGLAVQTLTGVGGQYRMLQVSIDYLRSPAVLGPIVQLRAEVVRAGRRLASLETVITGPDGTVFARAHANAQLFPGA